MVELENNFLKHKIYWWISEIKTFVVKETPSQVKHQDIALGTDV